MCCTNIRKGAISYITGQYPMYIVLNHNVPNETFPINACNGTDLHFLQMQLLFECIIEILHRAKYAIHYSINLFWKVEWIPCFCLLQRYEFCVVIVLLLLLFYECSWTHIELLIQAFTTNRIGYSFSIFVGTLNTHTRPYFWGFDKESPYCLYLFFWFMFVIAILLAPFFSVRDAMASSNFWVLIQNEGLLIYCNCRSRNW